MSSPTPHTFSHPLLGSLTGLSAHPSTPSVTHFRSIPFASIPARFRQSILYDHIPGSRNFIAYGTACPAPPQHDQTEASGGLLPGEEEKRFDEMSCLNLTISVPTSALGGEGGEKLPVLVYVHGGAFKVGSAHISALHDTTRLVELCITGGKPVIIVSIHYRLHWLGFLACSDLLAEAGTLGTPAANFGLHDQRNAFLWIKRFIGGFGGDFERITAMGESAGSGSIAMHMCSDVPLFKRAIMMSGTTATGPPVDLKYKEAEYLALLGYLGIAGNDPQRLRKLREVPVERLVEAVDGVGIPLFRAYRDEVVWPRGFPGYFTERELIADCEWVDEVVIGDSFFEGSIISDPLKAVSPDAFLALSIKVLGSTNAFKITSAYNITPISDRHLFWHNLSYLMGDIMFSSPTHNLAQALASAPNKKVYRYTQTLRNPFPGSPLSHVAGHHFIELLLLFGTLSERYRTQKLRDINEEYGRAWLRFVVGEEPWAQYETGNEEKIMVINGRTGFELRTREEDVVESEVSEEGARRYKGWGAVREVMEDLAKEKGIVKAEETRMEWGTDGGIFRLAGLQGPYGIVLP